MKDFKDIQNEYAKEEGYRYWAHYCEYNKPSQEVYELLAERYGQQKSNESFQLASEILMYDDTGREGCTWGDTEFDSKSVEFGYNTAIESAKKSILKLKNK